MENIFTVKSKRGTACEHPMQFLFYPHALLIALISRTAQYTDTVSCGNVQPKAVCTLKVCGCTLEQITGAGFCVPAVSYSRRGLPVRPEKYSPGYAAGRLLSYSSTVRQVLPSLVFSSSHQTRAEAFHILKCSPDDSFQITPDIPSD